MTDTECRNNLAGSLLSFAESMQMMLEALDSRIEPDVLEVDERIAVQELRVAGCRLGEAAAILSQRMRITASEG